MGYTDSVSRSGLRVGGADNLELFLKIASKQLIESYEERNVFSTFISQRTIMNGKSATFPIVGRKRGAVEHTPGDLVFGGTVPHNDKEITLDPILLDSIFVAEIDELMSDYDVMRPYMTQLAESLSVTYDTRAIITMLLAARDTTVYYPGAPVPGAKISHANMNTDPAQLESAAFATVQAFREKDISGEKPTMFLRPAQHILFARYAAIDLEATSGSGNRAEGTVGHVAGLSIRDSNHIPSTLITVGNTKYQGDFTKTTGIIATGMAAACLNLRGMKLTVSNQEDRLGTLLIASKACGMGKYRNEVAQEIGTP